MSFNSSLIPNSTNQRLPRTEGHDNLPCFSRLLLLHQKRSIRSQNLVPTTANARTWDENLNRTDHHPRSILILAATTRDHHRNIPPRRVRSQPKSTATWQRPASRKWSSIFIIIESSTNEKKVLSNNRRPDQRGMKAKLKVKTSSQTAKKVWFIIDVFGRAESRSGPQYTSSERDSRNSHAPIVAVRSKGSRSYACVQRSSVTVNQARGALKGSIFGAEMLSAMRSLSWDSASPLDWLRFRSFVLEPRAPRDERSSGELSCGQEKRESTDGSRARPSNNWCWLWGQSKLRKRKLPPNGIHRMMIMVIRIWRPLGPGIVQSCGTRSAVRG